MNLANLTQVELRKMVDTRGGKALTGTALALMAAVACVTAALEDKPSVQLAITLASTPLVVLVPIVAINSFTTEWSQRGGLTTFAASPRRPRVAVAKILATIVIALAYVASLVFVAVAAAFVSSSLKGTPGPHVGDLTAENGAGPLLVTLLANTLLGAALGAVIPTTAVAIVVFFVFTAAVDSVVAPLGAVSPYLSFNAAVTDVATGAFTTPLPSVAALVIWVALPLAFGIWRFTVREVK